MIGNGDIQLSNYCLMKFFYLRLWFNLLEKKKKNLGFKNRKRIGALGSILGHTFDMGKQNGSKREVQSFGFLISYL